MENNDVRFALLWGEAHVPVRSFIRGLVGDPTTIDDLVQEVALEALKSFHNYDASRSFTGWVLGVARHLVHHHWANRFRHGSMVHDLDLVEDLAQVTEEINYEFQTEREALRACLNTVEGRSWEIMQRFYVEGESTVAIAEHFKLAVGHVRVMMHRIRNALKTCVERRMAQGIPHG